MAHVDHIANNTVRTGARAASRAEASAFGTLAVTLLASLALIGLMVEPVALALAGAGMLAAGLVLASGLWLAGVAQRQQIGAWDVAGLLVFLGFAAGIMCGAAALT